MFDFYGYLLTARGLAQAAYRVGDDLLGGVYLGYYIATGQF